MDGNKEKDIVDSVTKFNSKEIECQICQSKILKKRTCVALSKAFPLPLMKVKDTDAKVEVVENFWLINGMMTFENIGFTNSVDKIKFLICADCEIGPIGYQNLEEVNELYVARDRVSYRD